MSDVYSFDSDATAPTDAQKRLLFMQQLRQAANATPGQAAAAPNIPNVDPAVAQTAQATPPDGMLQALRAANAAPADQASQVPAQQTTPQPTPGQVPAALSVPNVVPPVQVAPQVAPSEDDQTARPFRANRVVLASQQFWHAATVEFCRANEQSCCRKPSLDRAQNLLGGKCRPEHWLAAEGCLARGLDFDDVTSWPPAQEEAAAYSRSVTVSGSGAC